MGVLSHTVNLEAEGVVNITALAGEDYHIFSGNSPSTNMPGYRKAGGGSLITVRAYNPSGLGLDQQDKVRSFTASDSTSGAVSGLIAQSRLVSFGAAGEGGFDILLPAGVGERTAKVWFRQFRNNNNNLCKMSVFVSDGSFAPIDIDLASPAGGDLSYSADFTYSADSPGQTVTVRLYFNSATNVRAVHYHAALVGPEAITANHYLLEATPRAIALTRPSALLAVDRTLASTPSQIAVNSQPGQLAVGRTLISTPRQIRLTPVSVTTERGRALSVTPGQIANTPSPVQIQRTYCIQSTPKLIRLTGAPVQMLQTKRLSTLVRQIRLTPVQAVLRNVVRMVTAPAAIRLNPSPVNTRRSYALQATPASLVVTPISAQMQLLGPPPIEFHALPGAIRISPTYAVMQYKPFVEGTIRSYRTLGRRRGRR